ncbi:MAG TPA: glycosyltransferase family 1 protein [Burkholderiales bacterium]|nr:glycosyltransferase family 1 protein [Burkholderiales bacterium]
MTETYPPEINGVAMTIGRMVHGMLRRGNQIQLVRPRQHTGDAPRSAAGLEEVLLRGVPLPGYDGLRIGLPSRRVLKRLWKAERPDIVHVVTEGPLGKSALCAARDLRIPASSDFHTNFHSYSEHYGLGLLKPVIAGYLKRFHNRADCTFVPTRELRTRLEGDGYRNLLVVARGVDTTLFSPTRRSGQLRAIWGASQADLVATYVGRLAPEKNLSLVFASFEQIRRRLPSARLVLIGDGPLSPDLQRRYPEHVFAGTRRGEDLAAHYASADLFLFPSVTETYGNVTVEAMASGLAVVAYDYAAGREHLVHGESGLLAPFDEAPTFMRLAADLAVDDALLTKLRRNARFAALRISWDQVVDEFALALRGLAREKV